MLAAPTELTDGLWIDIPLHVTGEVVDEGGVAGWRLKKKIGTSITPLSILNSWIGLERWNGHGLRFFAVIATRKWAEEEEEELYLNYEDEVYSAKEGFQL